MSRTETSRTKLHEAIASVTPWTDPEEREEDFPEGGVITAWVLIAEWSGTDGNRWLSKLSADASGEKGLPAWTERGMAGEVHFFWPEPE